MVATFIALWSGGHAGAAAACRPAHMGEFFTKAAFLTIGGAYAVLPYVYQGAVEHYGWLTGAADDGRPGPGRDHARAADHGGHLGGLPGRRAKAVAANPVAAGLAGATVATFFTFLPSFLFIWPAGRWSKRRAANSSSPRRLTAITAAVVGVIVNLAVFFAWHTFWPKATEAAPFIGPFEWLPVIVAIAAFLALWKYKADIMKVIGVCALLGLQLLDAPQALHDGQIEQGRLDRSQFDVAMNGVTD
jgi:chromate transporter